MLSEYINDIAALCFMVAAICAYHVHLNFLTKRNPKAVLSRVAAAARACWVEVMLTDPGSGILAVQTLRNSTMAATFLASTSVLLMMGVLTLSGQAPALKAAWHALNLVGSLAPEIWLLKLLCILVMLFSAFFSFTNAVRIYNHVGYMINLRVSDSITGFSAEEIAGELNRAGWYFSVGMRSYYYVVPLVAWLFGPLYMIASTLCMVMLLLPRVDKVADVSRHSGPAIPKG